MPLLFTVRFPLIDDRPADLSGLLECMRYDLCRIVDWKIEPKEYGKIWVLRMEGKDVSLERWHSFGLYPQAIV